MYFVETPLARSFFLFAAMITAILSQAVDHKQQAIDNRPSNAKLN